MSTKHEDLPPIKSFDELCSIKQLVERYPDQFTESIVRWLLRNREENGISDAVIKVGNKIQLHPPRMLHIMLKQQGV